MPGAGLLPFIPLAPAATAAVIAVFGARFPYRLTTALACLGALASLALVALLAGPALGAGPGGLDLSLGPWIGTKAFHAALGFRLDHTAWCMALLVAGFGSLITIYSVGYMADDAEPGRFFASLNLFLAAMLTLVLADNLILIFLGWEGVGLCSYLLIGHYWRQEDVPVAAFRALFVNRIGDIFFILGVFSLYAAYGTFSLPDLAAGGAASLDPERARLAYWAAILILGGAFAKSAQAPLHVWLADAMAGPTPVSALIHAATMVTAGIYLVVRLDWLYAAQADARFVITVCSLVTLAVGALMALTQWDIKKILAYSTLANLALMFLAVSARAPGAALLHLFGHACFKALLFLAAGSVILAAHHEQDLRRLAGSLRRLPVTRAAFWVGCVGGAGLIPYLAAGFFSKEAVLEALGEGEYAGFGLRLPAGLVQGLVLVVELITNLYLFRLLGYLEGDPDPAPAHGAHAGHGDHEGSHHHAGPIRESSLAIRAVLAILCVLGPIYGIFSANPAFGGKGALYALITGGAEAPAGPTPAHALPTLALSIALAAACFLAYAGGRRRARLFGVTGKLRLGPAGPLARKFYFDDLYDLVLVRPLLGLGWMARILVETLFVGVPALAGWAGESLSLGLKRLQTGKAHQYAMAMVVAAFLLVLYLTRG